MDLKIHSPLPQRKDFRIGVLGSGFVVRDCHLVAYRKAGFNPVAIASRTRENAAKTAQRHGIPQVCDSCEQLLDDPSIEVIDIAVPPNAQLGLIKAACQRGTVKGILAQKPLGMNYAEAVEAVRVCEAAGITLAVNQNMRYDQSVRAGKTLLENGTIGDPVLATIEMRGIPHWMPWQAELNWVTLRIMSIHHLDCFRYWFGNPTRIFCSIRTDPRTKFQHTDGICSYILDYANGLRCVGIDDTWTGPAKEGCPGDIYIKWRIEGLNGLAIGDIGWCKDPYTTPSTIRYAAKGDREFQQPRWSESWFPDAFIGTMAQLLIALESGTEPAISGRDNLKTMALVEAAGLSAAQHRSIGPAEIERTSRLPVQDETESNLDVIREISATSPDSADGQQAEPEKKPGFIARLWAKRYGISQGEGGSMYNFTPRAKQVLALARREADRFNHNFVGTEHILLGVIKLGQGVAVNVLRKIGLNLETVRMEVEKLVGTGPGEKMTGNIPYTPRTKRVLALAAKEAKALNHTYVGTEHILLGLLKEGDGVAARVLKNMDVDIDQIREEILKELDPNFAEVNLPKTETSAAARFSGEFTPAMSPHALQLLALSRKEADRFNHDFVATEHLLLGLAKLGQGVAVTALENLGLGLETVRREVEKLVETGPDQEKIDNIPYTPRVKRVLALAAKEARALHHTYVGTEHILLGLLLEGDGIAARVLKELGVTVEAARREILKELDPNGS